jgi:hypothetical protein
MKLILEFNSFRYNVGDIVLIKYWFNDMITPVKITDKRGGYVTVSHDIKESKIFKAPDEKLKTSQIIDVYRTDNSRNTN